MTLIPSPLHPTGPSSITKTLIMGRWDGHIALNPAEQNEKKRENDAKKKQEAADAAALKASKEKQKRAEKKAAPLALLGQGRLPPISGAQPKPASKAPQPPKGIKKPLPAIRKAAPAIIIPHPPPPDSSSRQRPSRRTRTLGPGEFELKASDLLAMVDPDLLSPFRSCS